MYQYFFAQMNFTIFIHLRNMNNRASFSKDFCFYSINLYSIPTYNLFTCSTCKKSGIFLDYSFYVIC